DGQSSIGNVYHGWESLLGGIGHKFGGEAEDEDGNRGGGAAAHVTAVPAISGLNANHEKKQQKHGLSPPRQLLC
ncbi:hypothetical protein BO70DRAFT_427284, partial [Aspergillus heteromorphus CBS 117.55]